MDKQDIHQFRAVPQQGKIPVDSETQLYHARLRALQRRILLQQVLIVVAASTLFALIFFATKWPATLSLGIGSTLILLVIGAIEYIEYMRIRKIMHSLVRANPVNQLGTGVDGTVTALKTPTVAQRPDAPQHVEPPAEDREFTPDTATPPPTALERYPSIRHPTQAIVHEAFTVSVTVTVEPNIPAVAQEPLRFFALEGATSTTVDVCITAADFELLSPAAQPLEIPLEGAPDEPVRFHLIPQTVGARPIRIDFLQEGRYAGGATITVSVVTAATAARITQMETRAAIETQNQAMVHAPDLLIRITKSGNDGQLSYHFNLCSSKVELELYYHDVPQDLELTGRASDKLEAVYEELTALVKEGAGVDWSDRLSAIGANLYDELFPPTLKDLWTRSISGNVCTIQIVTNEPWIPWELVKPSHKMADGRVVEDGFLCEDYQLTRWLFDKPPAGAVRIRRGSLVSAAADLPYVVTEAETLRAWGNVDAVPPTLADVYRLLQQGGYELMHFAAHGTFVPDDYDMAQLRLEDGELRPRDISGSRRTFGRDRPLVFINACHSSRNDFALVGLGGWAGKFIDANAAAFVGAAWEVDDELAYLFSTTFYQALRDGQTVGEAAQTARQAIRRDDDPSWLAYTVYADPQASVWFDSA